MGKKSKGTNHHAPKALGSTKGKHSSGSRTSGAGGIRQSFNLNTGGLRKASGSSKLASAGSDGSKAPPVAVVVSARAAERAERDREHASLLARAAAGAVSKARRHVRAPPIVLAPASFVAGLPASAQATEPHRSVIDALVAEVSGSGASSAVGECGGVAQVTPPQINGAHSITTGNSFGALAEDDPVPITFAAPSFVLPAGGILSSPKKKHIPNPHAAFHAAFGHSGSTAPHGGGQSSSAAFASLRGVERAGTGSGGGDGNESDGSL